MGYLSNAELARLRKEYPEVSDTCPTCRGKTTYIYRGSERFCDCVEQSHLNVMYSHAGIGLKYQRLTWEDVHFEVPSDLKDFLARPQDYVDAGMGVFISGGIGTGKTLLVNLVIKDLIRDGLDCYYTTASQTVESFTSTWGDNDEKRRFADRFTRTKVLGIDDLGKEFTTKITMSTFDNLVRTRSQNARAMIVTSNLDAVDIRRDYGASALSMLLEDCLGVHLNGSDFRPEAHDRRVTEIRKGEARPIV
jgi:DNA replication protein DnaC